MVFQLLFSDLLQIRAPRDQMMANAGGQQQTTGGDKSDLVGNIQGQDVEAARGTK